MYFCANVSYASLPVYLPTILKNMGYSSLHAQGLSAPPYFVAFLSALLTTHIADKSQQRGLVLILTSLIGGIGYLILATVERVGVRYFATFLAAAGVFSTIPNILAWVISKFSKLPVRKFPTRQNTNHTKKHRQPRLRLLPRRRPRPHQPHRPMRPLPRHPHIPHGQRTAVHKRHVRLRRFHVFFRPLGPRVADGVGG